MYEILINMHNHNKYKIIIIMLNTESVSEMLIGGTSKDNYSPGPVIREAIP